MVKLTTHVENMKGTNKKALLELGQIALAAFLGNMTIQIFQRAGYIKGDLMVSISIIGAIILWFIYIDFLKWVAGKVPDEKRTEETEVRDQATH
jgi:phosphate starvation-inducible membrane PsiE